MHGESMCKKKKKKKKIAKSADMASHVIVPDLLAPKLAAGHTLCIYAKCKYINAYETKRRGIAWGRSYY